MAKDAMTKNNETDSENPFPQMSKGSQKHFQKKITLDDMQDISLGFEGNEFSAPEDACRLLSGNDNAHMCCLVNEIFYYLDYILYLK